MSDVKALGEIQRLARLDRIVVTRHAAVRMDQRGAKRGDVRVAPRLRDFRGRRGSGRLARRGRL